ncbi:hypothetical protein EAE96_009267 [Botrytis aclada]|nr:hypothetical protein EAE96_009267 [Botrytis aclada]
MGRLETRGASFDGGDGDRGGGIAAARYNESTTAGRAGGAPDGEDGGDIELARALRLEG